MIEVYKLRYNTREEGISDLLWKKIISEDLKWTFPTHAVVDLGRPIISYPTYDEQGNKLTDVVYGEGYLFDIMIEPRVITEAVYDELGNEISPPVYEVFDFGDKEVIPLEPSHSFAGHEKTITINQLNIK